MQPVVAVRKILNVSLEELAGLSGYSSATISLVETGKIQQTQKYKERLTWAMKKSLNMEKLFTKEDEEG